jgi:hypothetical protein
MNCEPYPLIPRTPGDLVAMHSFGQTDRRALVGSIHPATEWHPYSFFSMKIQFCRNSGGISLSAYGSIS